MDNLEITVATDKDRQQLLAWFKNYEVNKLIEKRVDCYLRHNFTVVAKDGNKIIGILQWHIKEEPDDGLAEVEGVFISKEYRRRGVGSSLLRFTIKTIREHFIELNIRPRKIFLFVGKENAGARKLYENLGFKLISSVGDLFHDKEEELFYTLNL